MADLRVAIVEDDRRTREGLVQLVAGTPGFAVTGAFGSVEEASVPVSRDAPDVVLMDIGLPGASGIEGVRRFTARQAGLAILVLTVHADDAHVFEAICAGATGYLLKDTPPSRLLQAIGEARGGGSPMSPEIARKVLAMFREIAPPRVADHQLSPREVDVLRVLAGGHSYKTAAAALELSVDTIRFHVRNIYEKLHVHSKSEAVGRAFHRGLVR